MKKFGLITNVYKDPGQHLSRKLLSYIEKKGGQAKIYLSDYTLENRSSALADQIESETECILVLGGDGTLIRAAAELESLEMPLIGVNLGTLGYLCELDQESVFDGLDHILADDCILEPRILLQGKKKGQDHVCMAMNDIVIHHGSRLQTIDLNVSVNGKHLASYKADGMIVATPTGSTGYSMSAGGPIVDPRGDMILLTPNNAHSLASKSIVLGGESVIEISLGERSGGKEPVCVSLDGDLKETLGPGETYQIARADHQIKIIRISDSGFLEILGKKIGAFS